MSENATGNTSPPPTARQRRAIEALVTAPSITQAAKQSGIARPTIWRWLRTDPGFRIALKAAEADALGDFSRSLVTLGAAITETIEAGLDPSQPITIRLRAAALASERLLSLRMLSDVELRLSALETVQRANTNYP